MSRRRLLRAGGPGLMGLRLRPAGRARSLREGIFLHRLDQPNHLRQQPIVPTDNLGFSKEVGLLWCCQPTIFSIEN